MANVKELAASIGKKAVWAIQGSKVGVFVTIIDAKQAYGTLRYEVQPVAGTGSVWVNSAAILIVEEGI